MKVAIQCESPLLQRSLELFLKGHLSSLKQCDVVIRDRRVADESRPMLLVSSDADADIVKPFSRSRLMMVLDQVLKKDEPVHQAADIANEIESAVRSEADAKTANFEILQNRIEQLTREYQQNILKTVMDFYER